MRTERRNPQASGVWFPRGIKSEDDGAQGTVALAEYLFGMSCGDAEPEARNLGDAAPRNGASHAAIATPLSVDEVKAIAARYGVSAKVLNRGGIFHVIEVWVDGAFLFEVLTPEFQAEYGQVTCENWEKMLARGPRPAVAA